MPEGKFELGPTGGGGRLWLATELPGPARELAVFAVASGDGWRPVELDGEHDAGHFVAHLPPMRQVLGDGLEVFVVAPGGESPGALAGRQGPGPSWAGSCKWEGATLSLFTLGESPALAEVRRAAAELRAAAAPAEGAGFMLGGPDTILMSAQGSSVSWPDEASAMSWLANRAPGGALVEAEISKLAPHRESDAAYQYLNGLLASQGKTVEDITLLAWWQDGVRLVLARTGARTWADNYGSPHGLN